MIPYDHAAEAEFVGPFLVWPQEGGRVASVPGVHQSAGRRSISAPVFPPMMWPDGTMIEAGQAVRTADTVKPARFARREGVVQVVRPALREPGGWCVHIGEVGVDVGLPSLIWFRPSELIPTIAVRPIERPSERPKVAMVG